MLLEPQPILDGYKPLEDSPFEDGLASKQLVVPQSLAILSMHTSPLSEPGSGDGGGLNVYVRDLSAAMANLNTQCDIYVRRTSSHAPTHVEIAPGVRLTHVDAGPYDLTKEDLPAVVDLYADRVAEHLSTRPVNAIHAHYWLSGVAGHRLKHELDIPLAVTFHTLARVKSLGGDAEPVHRAEAEQQVMGCADVVFASNEMEANQLLEHYDITQQQIRILTPGVNLELFTPGDRQAAQAELGLTAAPATETAAPTVTQTAAPPVTQTAVPPVIQTSPRAPVILFVGRLQPLKGADVAIQALSLLQSQSDQPHGDQPHGDQPHGEQTQSQRAQSQKAQLMIVGGPSGSEGERTLSDLHQLVTDLGLTQQVIFVPPQPHHLLPAYYRAADVCVMPSRSESFGLVALEAAACGVPVVASNVGGLISNVIDGVTGLLVSERDPACFAAQIDRLLNDPVLASRLGSGGSAHAADHTWKAAAATATAVFASLPARELLVACA